MPPTLSFVLILAGGVAVGVTTEPSLTRWAVPLLAVTAVARVMADPRGQQWLRRSLTAGYDLVYVYAGHALGGIHHFLSPRYNDRTDEYGGSIENRMRLLREILEDTIEEVDGRAAVACRITVDELLGDAGITRAEVGEIVEALGEMPDLWDFVLGSWEDDSVTARFNKKKS